MKKFISKKALYAGVGILILGVVGYFLFLRPTTSKEEIFTVRSGDFLQQISVSGKVVAAKDADLGFSQSGRVTHVYGVVGKTVSAGTLLAEIENADIYATVLQKQASLETQQARLQSLKNGTRPEGLAVLQSTVDGAVSALEQANQGVVNAILNAYAKSDDVVRNSVDTFFINPRGDSPKLSFIVTDAQLEIDIAAERLAMEKALVLWQSNTQGLVAKSDLSKEVAEAEKNLSSVASLLGSASDALNRAIESETVTEASLSQYTNSVSLGRTSINTSITSLNAALTAQKNAVASLNTARKNLTLQQAGPTQADIDAQIAQVNAAYADLKNTQAQLQKTRIVAPFTGVITKVDAKVGEIVSPNTPLVSMIGNGTLQIESYIPEINIALVKVGNNATVTLDAYGTDVPFSATVVSIDPAETIQNGVSTYRAVLEFSAQDVRIKSGMTASVVITTREANEIISVPQGVVIEREGKKFLPVKNGSSTVDVEVVTGEVSSLGTIEILSGLKDGDVVVLGSSK